MLALLAGFRLQAPGYQASSIDLYVSGSAVAELMRSLSAAEMAQPEARLVAWSP